MSNDDSEVKITDINKIVFGVQYSFIQCQNTSNLMDIEAVESDEEVVF